MKKPGRFVNLFGYNSVYKSVNLNNLIAPLLSLCSEGCGGSLNQTFGQLQIDPRSYSSYLRCNWAIGNAGISQAVALVSIQELSLSYL